MSAADRTTVAAREEMAVVSPNHEDMQALSAEEREPEALMDAWIEGRLYTWIRRWAGDDRAELDRAFGRWAATNVPGWDNLERERSPDDQDIVRRWCWARGLYFCTMDDDVEAMREANIPTLLCEAAHECPKKDYIYYLVGHCIRDSAFSGLVQGKLVEKLQEIALWRPAIGALGPGPLLDYTQRLLGYVEARAVSCDDAVQRTLDLRRCEPTPEVAPEPRLEGSEWVCTFMRGYQRFQNLYIDCQTGAMRVDPERYPILLALEQST